MQKGWARFVRAQPFAASSVTTCWTFWREARENFYEMCLQSRPFPSDTASWQVDQTLEGLAQSRTGSERALPEVPVGFVGSRR